ncbi:MAG: conserved putative secreted protein [Solirubrobacterales bacterium]|nr:conserved putative secreted protein [Solirubrobacterales bacterium]
MYEADGFFVANPLERYTLGDRSDLQYEKDGSLDVYIQTEEPTGEAEQDNWLPAPAGPFQLIMRLYGTDESAIAGILEGGTGDWTPPTILPCLESGKTAAGWSYAS